MNTNLQIYVRVINAARGTLSQVQTQVNGVTASLDRATISSRAFNRSLLTTGLESWGKNIQWVGRQIEYSFTIPLVLAGAAALKTSNANQAAMTRLIKVYGDGTQSTKQIKSETAALQKVFIALSDTLGISQADITNIGADWAAAGASGVSLARQTKITAEAMLLGEMSAKDATDALIAISAQYKFNSKQLEDTVGILNAVENQTGATFAGLIDAFQRSAGFAQTAGVDVRHLAADIAALTPASGSAANAGNALKTIFSRILAPTGQAADVIGLLGINIGSTAWQSQNAQERLITLAKATQNLTGPQRALFDTYVAGRYQISRFSTLLDALVDKNSFYQKALDATNSKQKIAATYTRELSTVLASQPQTFAILKTRLQNAVVQGFTPLVPAIEAVVAGFVVLANKFADMDPKWQKFILYMLAALALFGPLLRYVGASALLFARLGKLVLDIGAFAVIGFYRAGLAVIAFSRLLLLPFGILYDLAAIIVSGFARGLLAALPVMASIAGTVFSTLGNALRILWTVIMISLEAVTVGVGAGLVGIWQIVISGIGAITVTWGTAFRLLWASLWTSIQVLTSVWGSGFTVFWRALLTEIELLTTAWGRIFGFIWAGVMTSFEAITIAVGASIRTIWTGIVLFFGSIELWGKAISIVAVAMSSIGQVMLRGIAAIGEALLPAFLAALTSPITYAIIGALALIIAFRKTIGSIFSHIGDAFVHAFEALPNAVQNALKSVFNIVVAAVKAIKSWLSELNPFKRHSPSLVDNVKAGTHQIAKHYSGVGKAIKSPVADATNALGNLKNATAPALGGLEQAGLVSQRAQTVAAAPGAGAAYDAAAAAMLRLERALPGAEAAIARQQAVVDKWKSSLDKANEALDAQDAKLKLLKDVADVYSDRLSNAQDKLKTFTDAPIAGMKAMDDQIFNNTQQTNQLQLALLKLQSNAGVTDLAGQLSKVNGELEQLRGQEKNLRALGAGSDILGPLQDQIKALEGQAGGLSGVAGQYNDLQQQLASSQQQGQILDLTKQVTFDPLTKQIQDLTNTTKELPIDQIISGIKQWTPVVAANQAAYDKANDAVKQQQVVVDQLTITRDRIQASYDVENNKLTKLNDTYQANVDLVNKLKDAMSALASAADSAKNKQSDVADAFGAAGAGDFADASGSGFSIAGDQGDQTKAINDLAKQWQDQANKAFGGLDLFGPIKDMWNGLIKWLREHAPWLFSFLDGVVSAFKKLPQAFSGINDGLKSVSDDIGNFFRKNKVGKEIAKWVGDAAHDIANVFKDVVGFFQAMYKLFGPDLAKIGHALAGAFKPLGGLLKDVFSRLGPILSGLFKILKPLLYVLGVVFLGVLKVLSSVLANTLGPAFSGIITVIKLVFDTFADFIQFFVDVFTGKWSKALGDIGRYFKDTWDGITGIFKAAWDFLYGAIKGFVEGIVNFFKWLYDELVGHSIIPDLVNGIISWFQFLFTVVKDIWNALWTAIKFVYDNIIYPVFLGFKWAWDNILYPTFQATLTVFTDVWKAIGTIIRFVWTVVILPIYNLFKWGWEHILSPMLDDMKNGFAEVWEGIGAIVSFAYNNVVLPIYHLFDDAWNNILKKSLNGLISGFYFIFNHLGSIVATGINIAIDALDALIGGVNWILKHIGIGSQIGHIDHVPHPEQKAPQLAAGGVAPFKTDGIRAIVGEGNPNYPEYVIPTDPKFRSRAQALHEEAAKRLFASGGTLPNASIEGGKGSGDTDAGRQAAQDYFNKVKNSGWASLGGLADDVVNGIKQGAGYIRKGAVIAAMAPFLKAFDGLNSFSPRDIQGIDVHKWMNKEKNDFYNWAKGDKKTNRDFGPNWEKDPPTGFKSWEDWANQGQFTGGLGGAWQEIIQFAKFGPNFTTALPGLDRGGHSYHESGNAIDFSGGDLDAMAKYWYNYKGYLLEEIHSPSWFVKNGKTVDGPSFYGNDIIQAHYNHVHIAATKAAMDKLLASHATLGGVGLGGSGEAVADQAIGRAMAAAAGWSGGEWDALDALWTRESGWRWDIGNPSSGAYGIPQALPASKMASAGADWHNNPATQIRWGLQYIRDTYGSPSAAWQAWLSRGGSPYGNWYQSGGVLPDYPHMAAGGIVKARTGGTLVRVGEAGQDEKIVPLPANETSGGHTINFYGNLEFPNVKDGNSANEFLKNLQVLVKR